ncbi:ABC1 kinase family protein [Aureimonas jatrophae]|uniref:Predicted unusual protein kinase regulating ubiquinone biosynthesis, AarF/ABC1/UbiB family n=1 Tax=Aureimonas jatrophae TaxID=1166073 RepID=A0A1H0C8D0_9HYPH|nr:AarF/ABC1/UbiB kinase family protein [Aureimonas jatrophae]MBB3949112.1 putative unusual protein kinase regulating ubiquinone biosynthesis (AarF/ABC1/UbiB family) [Aureimonas jatrophae]SDN54076.1 Predicted unusual protein kinase regulating ubiquinone biosynthesis, AarF/ABC1/UbiB family [Aureimonas jatrophae]
MSRQPPFSAGSPVPSRRLSRLARLGGMAGGLAGGVLLDGARRLASGERPRWEDLVLTPGNVARVTDQLAQLRGAAMKMGQLLSMDAGDLLPSELSSIMARLRADAEPMPRAQVQGVLDAAWGRGWEAQFEDFPFRPVAAASIGQVHRALTRDGRLLAVKIQYPGVRRSIDSDVDNVATLLRVSRILPAHLDISPLLSEAKRQLHEEADYEREAGCLDRFRTLLGDDPAYLLPSVERDLTRPDVLAMTYLDSVPIETLETAPQEERDRTAERLLALAMRELFEFQLMQTDPNLANYRYDLKSQRIVLLDFGATRAFPVTLAEECRGLARAALAGSRNDAQDTLLRLGLLDERLPESRRTEILRLFAMATEPLRRDGPYDFGDQALARALRDEGMAMATDRRDWRLPPVDALFLQRKFAGTYLLAARLRARVDVRRLIERYV